MSIAKQEFTDAGRSMLGRAQNTEVLRITKIVVGSGTAAQPSDLWPLTALKQHKLDVTISARRDFGNGQLMIEGSFRSDQAPSAFDLKEVGIMAHIGAEADRLYSVANSFADPPDHIDPAALTIQVFKVKLIVDRIPAAQLILEIGPTENVMGENIGADTVGAGVYKEALGNVLRFKRLVEGPAIEIEETPDTITIGQPMLKNNLDLYVPLTYPGITDPNVKFPTIQDAHNYLLKFMIPTDKFAKIHVAAGSFVGRLALVHPNGSQISIEGWPRQDRPVSAINYVNPTHKNVSVANGAEFVVNQLVWLMNALGWTGGSSVTAKAGNVLTLLTLDKGGRTPYNLALSGGTARISWCPTVIVSPDSPPWTGTEVLCACNYAGVSNMTFVGGYHALHLIADRTGLANIYAVTAGVGIACGPACVLSGNSDIIVANCDFGIQTGGSLVGHGGTPRSVDFCANGCDCGIGAAGQGVLGAVPGVAQATGVVYLCNNATGVRNWGATLSVGNVLFSNNDTGFDAAYAGVYIFGPFVNTPYNNRLDLWAHGMGYIEYYKGAGAEPVCSPIKNTAGQNQNAYIHV